MSHTIKFGEIKHKSVDIKEAFIDLIPFEMKSAGRFTEVITNKFKRNGLTLNDYID